MFTYLYKNVTLTVRQCMRFTVDTRVISDLTLNLPGVVVAWFSAELTVPG